MKSWRLAFGAAHALSGIFAGACVSIAAVDMPVLRGWRESPDLLARFGDLLGGMGKLMLPQLCLMLILIALLTWHTRRWAPLAMLGAIWGVTLAVHIPINWAILSGTAKAADVPALLDRWFFWHLPRTVMALSLPVLIVRHLRPIARARNA
jgi:MFS superfamily sulfate permease-like transporter